MNTKDKPCRIVFLGSGRVGKTCIIHRLLKLPFTEKYQATVEDIHSREIEKIDERIQLKLEILDTSGSFHFAGMLALSISKANALVLVFSMNDPFSLDYIKNLYTQIKSQREDFSSIPICLVCNKTDENCPENLNKDEIISCFVNEYHVESNQIIFTSAKLDENVMDIFHSLWTQNQIKKAFYIPIPKETSNWTLLTRRRISTLESVMSSNNLNHPKPSECPTMCRTKSLCQNSSKSIKELQKLSNHSKSFFKRSSTSSPKEWKKGDVLKLDCLIS